jgi:predicted DNA-binding transcriptional regulator YafY
MGVKNIYERFIWFDTQVRKKEYPNTSSLAKQFEISTKTAQRDIDFMRDRLSCPLIYDARERGYFYEDDTFSLPMIFLSPEELSALLIARKALKDISGGTLGKELSSVLNKITNILTKHNVNEDAIDPTFSLQLIEYAPVSENTFRAVLEGCLKKRRLSFTYFSPAKEEMNERKVDPYHLFNYMGTWHLLGKCHLRDEIRDFALNRISKPELLNETYKVPANFDFKKYFLSSFGLYKGKFLREVTLKFSPLKAKWIKDQVWHKDQKTRFLKDGSLELSFPVADFFEVKMEILKHGADVEVIKPKSLRELIKTEAEKITKIY